MKKYKIAVAGTGYVGLSIGLYYYDGRIWKEVKMEDNTPDKFYRGISSADAISAEGYITEAAFSFILIIRSKRKKIILQMVEWLEIYMRIW